MVTFMIIYGLLLERKPLPRHRKLLSAAVFRLHPVSPAILIGYTHKMMCVYFGHFTLINPHLLRKSFNGIKINFHINIA
jgi:hypothetical protein